MSPQAISVSGLKASMSERRWFRPGSWRSVAILIPFLVLFVVLSVGSPWFFNTTNLLNILSQQSATLIIAAAGTLVLISGGIDLSVGATYALAGVVSAQVALAHGVVVAVIVSLVVGLFVGLTNGVISTLFRINPLIATLAMSFIVSGIGSSISGGNLIVLTNEPSFAAIAQTEILGVRTSIWIALVVVFVLGLLLARTTNGRYLYAAGGNAEASRLAGIRVNWVRMLAFTLSGGAAALGGIIDTSRVLSAQSSSGTSLTFTVLAGIVVGGTSILGGEGAIWRTVTGVLFIALVGNGFDLLGINVLYQQIALGVILLVAVGIDAWSRVLRR
ncbi:ABC transporter permease [Demequina lutea]|uniref:Ribose transport system permease protein n=1 Tax=Demequina lutea TaxID=431489 RepID=A0A7Z0CGY0_9MICO|nr:ABC transporter permease [Demequina lutea]NYI40229.1 ribose transport system permease protein [Demequina lutea]